MPIRPVPKAWANPAGGALAWPAWIAHASARVGPLVASRFWWLVTGVGALALGCRLAYVFLVARHVPFSGDSVWYHLVGAQISEGHGFLNPSLFYGPGHEAVATAQFPPLYPAFVAVLDWVGVTTPFGHQVAGAIIGVSLVPLTALLARRLLGPVPALGAAIFVAVEPTLLAGDGAAMSETLAVPLLTLAVLLIYRARESARVRDWVLAGAVFGGSSVSPAARGLSSTSALPA